MDPVLFWNEVALEVHRRDFTAGGRGLSDEAGPFVPEKGGPTMTSRALAIVHIAIFNAVAGVTGAPCYKGTARPITLPTAPAPGTTSEALCVAAAVAGAAMTTLSDLWPAQTDFIGGRGLAFVAELGAGADLGAWLSYGHAVGAAVLMSRADDAPMDGARISAGGQPPLHRRDPFDPKQPFLGVTWGQVPHFCIVGKGYSLANYIAKYPAHLSAEYNAQLVEVRDYGSAPGSKRTQEQTLIGIFWGYDGVRGLGVPPRLYNQLVRQALEQLGTTPSTAELARLFALINAGMADAGIVAWDAKYHFDLWRPVIGVREHAAGFGFGHGAGHDPGIGDPMWAPLGAPQTNEVPGAFNRTPPFPAYPSGHATFGAVTFRLFARWLAEHQGIEIEAAMDQPFDFVSDEFNGQNRDPRGDIRPYHKRRLTLAEAIVENAISRVYLGVHWRFDGVSVEASKPAPSIVLDVNDEKTKKIGGVAIGLKLADDMYGSYFQLKAKASQTAQATAKSAAAAGEG